MSTEELQKEIWFLYGLWYRYYLLYTFLLTGDIIIAKGVAIWILLF